MKLASIKQRITLPCSEWKDVSPLTNECITFCKMSAECTMMKNCLTIKSDSSWTVHVYGQKIQPHCCRALDTVPSRVDHNSISSLLEILDNSTLCHGNENRKFVDMIAKREEKNVVSSDGRVVAYLNNTKVRHHTSVLHLTVLCNNVYCMTGTPGYS